jgi:hypothetical protein
MKQYTTNEQTAKLIELGFEKPKNERWVLDVANESSPSIQNVVKRQDFSIGELIEMLPEAICESKDDDYHYFLSIETDSLTWKVFYESEDEVTLCSTFGVELVDALCSMLTILKRQGTL